MFTFWSHPGYKSFCNTASAYTADWNAFPGSTHFISDLNSIAPTTTTGIHGELQSTKMRESHEIPYEETDFSQQHPEQ
jgi:hypothetical protein